MALLLSYTEGIEKNSGGAQLGCLGSENFLLTLCRSLADSISGRFPQFSSESEKNISRKNKLGKKA